MCVEGVPWKGLKGKRTRFRSSSGGADSILERVTRRLADLEAQIAQREADLATLVAVITRLQQRVSARPRVATRGRPQREEPDDEP